jgi:hypothetical protein
VTTAEQVDAGAGADDGACSMVQDEAQRTVTAAHSTVSVSLE